jgi:hypothetical protein
VTEPPRDKCGLTSVGSVEKVDYLVELRHYARTQNVYFGTSSARGGDFGVEDRIFREE